MWGGLGAGGGVSPVEKVHLNRGLWVWGTTVCTRVCERGGALKVSFGHRGV